MLTFRLPQLLMTEKALGLPKWHSGFIPDLSSYKQLQGMKSFFER